MRRQHSALESLDHAESLLTTLVREHSQVAQYSRELAMTLGLVTNVRLERGEVELAKKSLERSIDVLEAMGSDDPRDQTALENAKRLLQSLAAPDVAAPK